MNNSPKEDARAAPAQPPTADPVVRLAARGDGVTAAGVFLAEGVPGAIGLN